MTDVSLPPKFDETTATIGWAKPSYEDVVAELSDTKQFIRDHDGLIHPGDIERAAAMQAHQLEQYGKNIWQKKAKASKDFEPWQMTELELLNIKAREEAKRRYRVENTSADLSLFENSLNLEAALSLPEEPVQWRINKLLMVGHITTVTAPAKAGKTVLQVNRVKSFVDENPLFGHFGVGTALTGNVGVWNYELNQSQMHDWFRKKGIANTHKIHVINARGAGLFIQNDVVLERAIKWVKDNDIEILEIDPLQAAFVGSVNSDEDAASYINALQRLQKESGLKDIILTTHMGHAGKSNAEFERSIGSARWEGFPDNMWIYKRDGDTSYLRIDKGRMEPVPEFGLSCDTDTWTLTHKGDNSGVQAKKSNELFKAVVTSLYDGELKFKSADVVTKIAKTDRAKSKEVKDILFELVSWGLVVEGKEVREGSTTNQKSDTVQMNETGCILFGNMIANNSELRRPTPAELSLITAPLEAA